MYSVKAIWQVLAGVVPGHSLDQYGRVWEYTRSEYEHDQSKGPDEITRFSEIKAEVSSYVLELTDPKQVKWVETTFLWIGASPPIPGTENAKPANPRRF